MMRELHEETTIAKLAGSPSSTPRSQDERNLWTAFCDWLCGKFNRNDGLDEAFLQAKVAQEANSARKTLEEAAELAARAEEARARARLLHSEADGKLIENLQKLSALDAFGKRVALARLMDDDPTLYARVESIEGLIERLRLNRGTSIEFRIHDDEL
jgi:hypothetical protein